MNYPALESALQALRPPGLARVAPEVTARHLVLNVPYLPPASAGVSGGGQTLELGGMAQYSRRRVAGEENGPQTFEVICGTEAFARYEVNESTVVAADSERVVTKVQGSISFRYTVEAGSDGAPIIAEETESDGFFLRERWDWHRIKDRVVNGRFEAWFYRLENGATVWLGKVPETRCDYLYNEETRRETRFDEPPAAPGQIGDSATSYDKSREESATVCSSSDLRTFSEPLSRGDAEEVLGEWAGAMEGYLVGGGGAGGLSGGAWAWASASESGDRAGARVALWRASIAKFTGDREYLNARVKVVARVLRVANGSRIRRASFQSPLGFDWSPAGFGIPPLNGGKAGVALSGRIGESERFRDAFGAFGEESPDFEGSAIGLRSKRAAAWASEAPPGGAVAGRVGEWMEVAFLSLTGLRYRLTYFDTYVPEGEFEPVDAEIDYEVGERDGLLITRFERVHWADEEAFAGVEYFDEAAGAWKPVAECPLREAGQPLPVSVREGTGYDESGRGMAHLMWVMRTRRGGEWGFLGLEGEGRYEAAVASLDGRWSSRPPDGGGSCGSAPAFEASYSADLRYDGDRIVTGEGANSAAGKAIFGDVPSGYLNLRGLALAADNAADSGGEFDLSRNLFGNDLPEMDAEVKADAPRREALDAPVEIEVSLHEEGGNLVSDWQRLTAGAGETATILSAYLKF